MEPAAPDPDTDTDTDTPTRRRETARSRPVLPLPSDRIKLPLQFKILQTVGRLGIDRKAIPADRLSEAISKEASASTVQLSHSFFVACGWLERPARGEYVATDALINHTRRWAAGDQAGAMEILRGTAQNGWFWPVINSLAEHGPARVSEVVVMLMTHARVSEDHRPQIRMLLEWLILIGLIDLSGNTVTITTNPAKPPAPPAGPAATDPADEPPPAKLPEQVRPPAGTQVQEPTTPAGPAAPSGAPPVLSFNFSVTLTADDLAKLTAEQITAAFTGAAALAALRIT